jgi:hypothetical protein
MRPNFQDTGKRVSARGKADSARPKTSSSGNGRAMGFLSITDDYNNAEIMATLCIFNQRL